MIRLGALGESFMTDLAAPVDPRILTRTVRLFDRKRRLLPPDAVESLAREVVVRMADAVTARTRPGTSKIDPVRVDAFCDLLLKPDPLGAALDFIAARRSEGASTQDIYLGYIGEAALLLGRRWERDEVTPLQVTLAAGNLYALMRALRTAAQTDAAPDHRRYALFATVPGEQHGLGPTVAADLFRAAGWDIDLHLGLDHEGLVACARECAPGIIGLSLSTRQRVPEMVRAVLALRMVLPDAFIGVAPGGDLLPEDILGIADVDMVFGSVPAAIEALERLVVSGRLP